MAVRPAAVLDANVLVQAPLRDTLLRLAEGPELYRPLWSAEIMEELRRTLAREFAIAPSRIAHLESKLREHFPEAWIEGYELLAPSQSTPRSATTERTLVLVSPCLSLPQSSSRITE